MPHKTTICGNHEEYLFAIHNNTPDTPIPEVDLPILWSYRRLRPENREYYFSMPATAQLAGEIFISHSMDLFYRAEKILPFHAAYYKHKMETEPFPRTAYSSIATEALLARVDAMTEIRMLPAGVYLFGHNHLQFNVEIEGPLLVLMDNQVEAVTVCRVHNQRGLPVTSR